MCTWPPAWLFFGFRKNCDWESQPQWADDGSLYHLAMENKSEHSLPTRMRWDISWVISYMASQHIHRRQKIHIEWLYHTQDWGYSCWIMVGFYPYWLVIVYYSPHTTSLVGSGPCLHVEFHSYPHDTRMYIHIIFMIKAILIPVFQNNMYIIICMY